jgi:hypothetical protein
MNVPNSYADVRVLTKLTNEKAQVIDGLLRALVGGLDALRNA